MSNSKRQSIIIIGIGLMILAIILIYFSISQPKIRIASDINDTSAVINNSDFSDSGSALTKSKSSSRNTSDYAADEDIIPTEYPLNLNTCTAQELMTISGIGESKASAIIEYREYLGGYTSVEQIKNIKGIGDKVYEKISPYLTV